jgi:hypothetical protein
MGMSPRHMRLSERNWRGVICCEMSGRNGSDCDGCRNISKYLCGTVEVLESSKTSSLVCAVLRENVFSSV